MSSWARRCLAFAVLAVAWLVARPAAAAAPVCDERGASVMAPDPILDTPNASVDIGEGSSGCQAWTARDLAYQRGERPPPAFPSARGDLAPATSDVSVPAASARLAEPPSTDAVRAVGVRCLVERPPRA